MTNKRMNQGTTAPNYQDVDPAASLPVKVYWKIKSSPSGLNVNATGPCRFRGVVNATIDPSGELISDFIPIPLEVNTVLEVRVYTSATSWAPNMGSAHSGQIMGFVSGSDQTATVGDLASSFGSLIQPAMILVKPVASTKIPVVALGAFSMSIDAGAFDDFSLGNGNNTKQLAVVSQGGGGHIARAAKSASIPFVNFSLPGDMVSNFVIASKRYARSTLIPYLTDMVIPNPTNDIAGNVLSLAQIQANAITAIGQLGASGFGLRLWAGTVAPRSTSTDNWQTLANQGVLSANTESIRVNYNTWLRDGAPMTISGGSWSAASTGTTGANVARCAYYGVSGTLVTAASGLAHPLAAVWESADTVESSRNSGKWAAGTALSGITTVAANGQITSASPQFNSDMIGGIIVIPGAGAAGASLVTTVLTVPDSTHATLAANASTAVSGGSATARVLTSDGTHPCPLGHSRMAPSVPTAAISIPA